MKLYAGYRMVPFSVTLSESDLDLEVAIFSISNMSKNAKWRF